MKLCLPRLSSIRNASIPVSNPPLKFQPDLNSIYRHTSGNWLCNNIEHHAARTISFNIPAFCQLAAEATGANAVTDMLKISETFNRVFLLRFDTGREAIAKFPTSLAGPAHFATASEVATMDFLRRQLAFPIPRVLAWSSRAESTDVGTEFILMEKATGSLLSDVWGNTPESEQGIFATTLGEFERRLLELRFTHHGSLYYKNDVPAPLRAPTLLDTLSAQDPLSSEFCIGPIARRDFWEGEREHMEIDRGPWRTAEAYMKAPSQREKEWIPRFGTPHLLDHPSRVFPSGYTNSEAHISRLPEYIDLIPLLIPPLEEQTRPVLWHPDLHTSDIFVNPRTGDVPSASPLSLSSIIDWRGTCIGPAFLQLEPPAFFSTDNIPFRIQSPEFFAECAAICALDIQNVKFDEKDAAEELRKRELYATLFEAAAFPLPISDVAARGSRVTLDLVSGQTWKYGLVRFRTALCSLYAVWDDVFPKETDPSRHMSQYPEDLAPLLGNVIAREQLAEMTRCLDREFDLGEYGYVKGDLFEFEKVKVALQKRKLEYVGEGTDEGNQLLKFYLWPYRDTLRDKDEIPILLGLEGREGKQER